jgi:tyrosyl-tRNA synthetase
MIEITNIEELLTTWRGMPLREYAQLLDVTKIAVDVGFARSKSEAQRLIDQGGLRIDDVKINEPGAYVVFAPGDQPLTLFDQRAIVIIRSKS